MTRGLCIVGACAGLLLTAACGLERDWAAFQQASASGIATDGTSTTAGSTGPEPPGGSSSGSAGSSNADSSTSSVQPGTTGSESTTGSPGDTSTNSTTTGPAPVCGNGIVEGEEECDDPGQTACYKCVRDRLVFVTSSSSFNGNFGVEAADIDYDCNMLAAFAGLLNGNERRFKT